MKDNDIVKFLLKMFSIVGNEFSNVFFDLLLKLLGLNLVKKCNLIF